MYFDISGPFAFRNYSTHSFVDVKRYKKHPDSVVTAKHVILMRLMRCAPYLHHNKVDSIH